MALSVVDYENPPLADGEQTEDFLIRHSMLDVRCLMFKDVLSEFNCNL